MTGDVAELVPSTEPVARARAARIREGIHNYLETLAEVALAWERRDWQVLGYADWQAYVDGEFGAARLKLPTEHRQKAVAELRLAGMSQRAIGTALGVDAATVNRDLRGVADATPAEVRGADGKTYAATRPATARSGPADPGAGPEPGERVWIATARKGIAAHALKSAAFTRCGRATRTGLTLTARQSLERWEATWCRPCWPEQETTRFAAGEPVPTGPADEAHDPRASREAGAEFRGSAPAGTPETAAGVACTDPADGAATAFPHGAGHAGPAPAPSPASPGDGAGVIPAEDVDEPRLTVAQIGRLRAVFAWARARLAVHPRNAEGRGKPYTLGLEYAPREPTPPVHPDVARRGRAEHVEVCWEAGQVDIVYRSDRYEIDTADIYPADVDQAIDLLCAFGILPARFSRQYAAGIQAGMRGGDAIDGDLAATS